MTIQQEFGGAWTQDKLARLKGYLEAYMVIFRKHPYLLPVYVDAFAGTGRMRRKTPTPPTTEPAEADVTEVLKGSARIALEVEPPFSRYIFVERSARKCRELEELKTGYPTRADRIQIEKADATKFLTEWCSMTDWTRTRAVVFLDPFGMQVEWSLLKTLAGTQAIDLWLLVPLMGANRMMTLEGLPPEEWAQKLTRFFGSDEWRSRFYRPRVQPDLFGESSPVEKNVDFEGLAAYFVSRLKEIFPGVADNPLTQRNSRNSPMFLLCFATANPKPSTKKAALDIAGHLLKER